MARRTPDPHTPLLDLGFAAPEELAQALDAHPDYRVLRRLQPRSQFDHVPQGDVADVLILDTETTGLDASRDRIIELAMLRVTVDVTAGHAVRVVSVFDAFEDPGRPIPAEITTLTGITNDMVAGQQFDEAAIAQALDGVALVIAHNARFDRGFVERRLPVFAQLDWACSASEIDWHAEGRASAKLEWLAYAMGHFYDAHRADMDCHALLAVLDAPLPKSRGTGLGRLWRASRSESYRLAATGAPFDSKDALRDRGYRWDAGRKVWSRSLPDAAAVDAECAWLKSAVYGGRQGAQVELACLSAKERHAPRAGETRVRDL